jgi:hypothetical protein
MITRKGAYGKRILVNYLEGISGGGTLGETRRAGLLSPSG